MPEFAYEASSHVPFADRKQIERCRSIPRSTIEKHANPDFRIQVVRDEDLSFIWVSDMFWRIKQARDEGRRCVMILPNPARLYRQVARLINQFQVDCSHLHVFAMDEYANESGRIAPPDWDHGFVRAMIANFFEQVDPSLQPPREQFHGPTNENLDAYGRMIQDLGGAEICYSGPGWTGHLAFVEPDAPQFDAPLEQWKAMGTRLVTLSPFTLAQNSLHGSFGKSGDLAAVPPKAVTIGPAEVIAAHHRVEMAGITVHGTSTSWQRLAARLCYHGPVTPRLPSSIHQLLRTDCYITETNAQDIQPQWEQDY